MSAHQNAPVATGAYIVKDYGTRDLEGLVVLLLPPRGATLRLLTGRGRHDVILGFTSAHLAHEYIAAHQIYCPRSFPKGVTARPLTDDEKLAAVAGRHAFGWILGVNQDLMIGMN